MRKDSLLLTHGLSNIVFLGDGGKTEAGHGYMYLVGDISQSDQRKVKGVYSFALPFKTELHLFGIPKGEEGSLWTAGTSMERVVLEGDYQSYFSLYVEEGQQSLSRYHIDPRAMAFSIDFCSKFHWEIVNNVMYFLDEEMLDSLAIADEFIRLITPAFKPREEREMKAFISQLGEDLEKSYLKLKCPICSIELSRGKQWLACSEGHGYLVTGSELLGVRRDNEHAVKQLSKVLGRPPKVISKVTPHDVTKELTCPHCGYEMSKTEYQHTGIILDVCPHCPYRWIDGVELDAVLGKYRHESY